MCQLDWAKGCPDIWLNIILGVRVRVLLDEINISTRRLNKADRLPQCGWASFKGEFTLHLTVSELGHGSSPALGLELHHWLFWVPSLQMAGHGTSQPP